VLLKAQRDLARTTSRAICPAAPPALWALTTLMTLIAAAGGALAGCGGRAEPVAQAPLALQVGQENVVRVARDTIVAGPIISGQVRARDEATVRAEIGGPVLQVTVEEGQAVRRGALLARIEGAAQEDAQRSAASAVRSAENQLALSRREAERTEQLVAGGALAARDLDQARTAVTQVEAQLADARARLVAAEKQFGDAVLRAPITGIISDRAVNVGDVVSPGTAMFTIIDPSSMRLEASVPSDELSALKVGGQVQFRVRGNDQMFTGTIERISPATDPTTGQVPIFASIPNAAGQLVAGLYAEGRVVTESADGLVVPMNAVNTAGREPWVLRAVNGKTERIAVQLGLRDLRTERVAILNGVNEGDILLRGAAQGITPGSEVQVGAPPAPAASQRAEGQR
jgi:RND family efflux transporter MFP subunit